MTAPTAEPEHVQKRVNGPKSCLLFLLIGTILGLGSIAISKVLFDRRNASVLSASEVLASELARAEAAPGASAVRALGCDAAGALSPEGLRTLGQELENEEAKKKKRPATQVDLHARGPIVYCARKGQEAVACADIAKAFASSATPSSRFVVTSRTTYGEHCSELYEPSAALVGSAESPNLPALVPPPH